MNILVVGGGGREHALVYQLSRKGGHAIFSAPGNPGTAQHGKNLPIKANDLEGIREACRTHSIDLAVIGPEEPLVLGLADQLRADGVRVVGPGKAAARLEGSKEFSKDFMQRHGIPTARYRKFGKEDLQEALEYVRRHPLPVVVKADGLAAGKGVAICNCVEEAEEAVAGMLAGNAFGVAGSRIVVEEYLNGVEVSVFALCDGQTYVLLPCAKDYKRIFEGNRGPNTGGMGAVSPVFFASDAFLEKVRERVLEPTLRGMTQEGSPFLGFLFVGLMVVADEPFVLEYNVRLGDPETEAILPRIESNFADLLLAAAEGKLSGQQIQVSDRISTTVVIVSDGYPGDYPKGLPISGLDRVEDTLVFHAGTAFGPNGEIITSGGRVLALTALGNTGEEARSNAMRAAQAIHFQGAYFRRDIGEDLMELQEMYPA